MGVTYRTLMKGTYRREVELPPSGLLMPYEKLRMTAVLLSLMRPDRGEVPRLPYDMAIEIVRVAILGLPHYGTDPAAMLAWFWNQPTAYRTNAPYSNRVIRPIPVVQWDGTEPALSGGNGVERLMAEQTWGVLDDKPRERGDPLPPPPAVSWKDLSLVFVVHVSGSSMAHRQMGTATWYPNDIDIFVATYESLVRRYPICLPWFPIHTHRTAPFRR